MVDAPSIGEKRVTTCLSCEQEVECIWDADPYAEEIHNNSTPVWECVPCRRESARDI
jgi:hypothetical protein